MCTISESEALLDLKVLETYNSYLLVAAISEKRKLQGKMTDLELLLIYRIFKGTEILWKLSFRRHLIHRSLAIENNLLEIL
jgi:hypothetical protein